MNTIGEASGALMQSLEGLKTGQVDQQSGNVFEFTNRDTILYALGGNYLSILILCNNTCVVFRIDRPHIL